MTDHIIPPRELVEQWASEKCYDERDWLYEFHIATRAAQWGADQQLVKDAEWLDHNALNEPHLRIIPMGESLIEAMRLKPLSLKEQALEALDRYTAEEWCEELTLDGDIIRRALASLPDTP